MRLAATSVLLAFTCGCFVKVSSRELAEDCAPEAHARVQISAVGAEGATWPAQAQFDETATALASPFALVTLPGSESMFLASRQGCDWVLEGLGERAGSNMCLRRPCRLPSLVARILRLEEPAGLPEGALEAVVYARTLVAFEGPLVLKDAKSRRGRAVGDSLEELRRYQPVADCSWDTYPQIVALKRARAAAREGRTGWAVQGWLETVSYWSRSRRGWTVAGSLAHSTGHEDLLEQVGVSPLKMTLGLVIQVSGLEPVLHPSDARRLASALGPRFEGELRALVADSRLDPYNRALLLSLVAESPVEQDPLYRELPAATQALLSAWFESP